MTDVSYPVERLTMNLLRLVDPTDDVLDIGCGPAPFYMQFVSAKAKSVTMLDAHLPYLQALTPPESVASKLKFVWGEALTTLPMFRTSAFHTSLMIDVVEHFDIGNAVKMLQQASLVTAKRMIAFIPEGHHPQDKDEFQMGADHWQTHRSTWTLEGVASLSIPGFKRRVCERWENFHAPSATAAKDPHAIFAVWERGS